MEEHLVDDAGVLASSYEQLQRGSGYLDLAAVEADFAQQVDGVGLLGGDLGAQCGPSTVAHPAPGEEARLGTGNVSVEATNLVYNPDHATFGFFFVNLTAVGIL